MLVAPDVDALCAARIMAELFRQDDVIYRIMPISGIAELERVRDELITYSEVRCRIFENEDVMINSWLIATYFDFVQYGWNS